MCLNILKNLALTQAVKTSTVRRVCIHMQRRKNLCSRYLIDECHLRVNEIDLYGQNPIYYTVREGRRKQCS